ncbi:MAG: hypothetical protein V3R86_05135, partial [Candidatus Hydrothermarchaeaceae archaeon]
MRLKFGTKIKKGLIIAASLTLLLVYTTANSATGPIITEAGVDPVKVRPGDTMTVTVAVEDESGVSDVIADMDGIDTLELEIVEGTIYNGIWQKEWLVHDTVVKDYNTTIIVTNMLGLISKTIIEWSDPD